MKKRKQVSQYDKIFRENLEAVIPGLIENVLGIQVVESEEIPDDLQHTKERKPDALKRITDINKQTFVLHLEFQVVNDPDMVFRMADYYLMLRRKYSIPVEQYVIFIGPDAPVMPTSIDEPYLQFRFRLLDFRQLDYNLFIRSKRPEDNVLGVLAGFGDTPVNEVLERIVQQIERTAPGNLAFNRYMQQLRILAQLRKLEPLIDQIMLKASDFFREEIDPVFIRGEKKGEQKGEKRGELKAEKRIVKSLLSRGFSVNEVADMAEVSVEFVRQVQRSMPKN